MIWCAGNTFTHCSVSAAAHCSVHRDSLGTKRHSRRGLEIVCLYWQSILMIGIQLLYMGRRFDGDSARLMMAPRHIMTSNSSSKSYTPANVARSRVDVVHNTSDSGMSTVIAIFVKLRRAIGAATAAAIRSRGTYGKSGSLIPGF